MMSSCSTAAIQLPHLFSSHMVLQREAPIRIWGKAGAGEKITVRFHQQTKKTTAGKNGDWDVILDKEKAGGPFELQIQGANETISFEDVLVGEVWVCSGQSNMEWSVAEAKNNAEEITNAEFPLIRQFDVPNRIAFAPEWNTDAATWQVCSPATAGRFSAVAYFFARKLYQELKVPVGLINSTWGGTEAEAWTSKSSLLQHPDFTTAFNDIPANEDEYAGLIQKRNEALIKKFQGRLNTEDEARWNNSSYDDAAWPALSVNKLWEEQGLADFDGVVTYRTVVQITAAQAGKKATLHLGAIDDDDLTFVNGKPVGETRLWNAERKYALPAGVLHEGVNVILVKAIDNGGGGGFHGASEKAIVFEDGMKASLPSIWKAQIGSGRSNVRPNPNELPSSLYNAMIAPLRNYTIRGAIWYQGEGNADRPKQYETLFPLMINDWRKQWRQGNFPFYFVQLSSYDPEHKPFGSPSNWAQLREAQRKTLSLPNTGMAVTIDIGERDDIHPKNKQDVGLRLALIALEKTFRKQITSSGPATPLAVRDGDKIIIGFKEAAAGLHTRTGSESIEGFDCIDAAGKVYPVQARLEGKLVIINLQKGINPVAVRYAWADDAGNANLYNGAGLPTVPFSTEVKSVPFQKK